jgi:two-component sensor histidine kinase
MSRTNLINEFLQRFRAFFPTLSFQLDLPLPMIEPIAGCETLAASMTDQSRPISLKVQVEGGTASSAEVGSIGLIVTELVINAFKHAFVDARAAGLIVVAYESTETSWRLAVSDNGIGTFKNA